MLGCSLFLPWWIIGGSRGAPPACAPPTGSNSFVFTHVFTEKHTCRRLAPPTGQRPPTENPGSATALYHEHKQNICYASVPVQLLFTFLNACNQGEEVSRVLCLSFRQHMTERYSGQLQVLKMWQIFVILSHDSTRSHFVHT